MQMGESTRSERDFLVIMLLGLFIVPPTVKVILGEFTHVRAHGILPNASGEVDRAEDQCFNDGERASAVARQPASQVANLSAHLVHLDFFSGLRPLHRYLLIVRSVH